MAHDLYPKRGETVKDLTANPFRIGTILKIEYINNEDYICVKFHGENIENQFPYEEFFTKNNCGQGRWDDESQMWLIEPLEDQLPNDHPDTIMMHKMFENMNKQLLEKRLKDEAKLPVCDLLMLSVMNRKEADDMGENNKYYNWYFYRAEDYARMAQYKVEDN